MLLPCLPTCRQALRHLNPSHVARLVVLLGLPLLLLGCAAVPMTGRSQLNLVTDQQMTTLSLQQYASTMQQAKLSQNPAQVATVRRVGTRIAAAAEEFVREQHLQQTFQWEFNVIDDPKTVNAWCMPGGKIAVYTGILPVAQNDAGLAVVLGHEVGHALARHGAERLSQQMVATMGTTALDQALADKPEQTRQLYAQAVGAAVQYGILLPYSRQQELEADYIGLMLLAKAGYEPQAAVAFWQRMSAANGSQSMELLSTHPADSRRIAQLQGHLAEAQAAYLARNPRESSTKP